MDNKVVAAALTGATVNGTDFDLIAKSTDSYEKSFAHHVRVLGFHFGPFSHAQCSAYARPNGGQPLFAAARGVLVINWSPVGHNLLNQDAFYWCSVVDVDNQVAYYSELFRALHLGDVVTYNVEFGQYVKETYAPTRR